MAKKKIFQFIRSDHLLTNQDTYTVQAENVDDLIDIVYADYRITLECDRYAAPYWNEVPTSKPNFKKLVEDGVSVPLTVFRNGYQDIQYILNEFEI